MRNCPSQGQRARFSSFLVFLFFSQRGKRGFVSLVWQSRIVEGGGKFLWFQSFQTMNFRGSSLELEDQVYIFEEILEFVGI